MSKFIKSYHFEKNKLSDEWCKIVANEIYFRSGCVNLLEGKDVKEIEQYASGDIDMKPFVKMFKSYKRKLKKIGDSDTLAAMDNIKEIYNAFQPLPLIPVKLNSATQLVHKTGFDITVKAIDTLASEQREQDVDFLQNRQFIQALGQELSSQLSQGDFDAGETKFSATKFKEIPLGLDLSDSLERKVFMDVVYKLQPEASYETILQTIYEYEKMSEIDLLEVQDTFKYGVCCNRVQESGITGLPEVEYTHPISVFATPSLYPDFRDNSERYIRHRPTVNQLYNMFGKEIGDTKALADLVNAYTNDNKLVSMSSEQWGTHSLDLIEFQVISMDGLYYVENKNGNKRFITDEDAEKMQGVKGIFGQNTYVFYWLFGTEYFFGKKKLGFAYRKQGREAFTLMPTNIYRSQKKSAVEQCIGENKKAILADIKLQHAILKAKTTGSYIDLKYLRNAASQMAVEGKSLDETMYDLLDMFNEENIMIGSSEGFDGVNEGQGTPVREIPGGLKNDINGYLLVMQQAAANISKWTGINDDLAGLNDNARSLNGARKLSITYGMNSINYAYEARLSQYKNAFYIIAWHIKKAIEDGGVKKKAIEELIGKEKVEVIHNLGELANHQFFLNVGLGMRDEEAQEVATNIAIMEQKGQLSRLDKFIVNQTSNVKDASLLLAAIEHKVNKKEEARQEQMFGQQQQLQQQRTEGELAVAGAEKEAKKELTYTQGDVAAKLMEMGNQLQLTNTQMDAVLKQQQQAERLNVGLTKERMKLDAKEDLVQSQEVKALI